MRLVTGAIDGRRAAGGAGGARLSGDQRRLLLAVCVASGAAYLEPATYNYVVNPILVSFGVSGAASGLLREIPSIASLLVIFLAAVAGARYGQRRTVTWGAVLLLAGSALAAAAPAFALVVAGLAVQGVGATILLVVPLGLLGAAVSHGAARATAFGVFSMVSPLVFVVLPVLTGFLMQGSSWRIVAATWAVGGLAALLATRGLLAADVRGAAGRDRGELITPTLGGLVCVALVQAVSHTSTDGLASPAVLVRLGLALLAMGALVVALRRIPHPALDVAALRQAGVVLLLIVLALWCFTQLWYYMTLAYEYVFGLDVVMTAILMVPAQLCAAFGARAAGWLVPRLGITTTGCWLLVITGGSLFLSVLVNTDSPLWWPVLITCLYSFASVGAGVPMTNALMDTAATGREAVASAYRQAAISIGTVIGIALVSALVLAGFSSALADQLSGAGLAGEQSEQVAAELRLGSSAQDAAAAYAVPLAEAEEIDDLQRAAYLSGMTAQGWSGGVVSLLTAGVFVLARRRQEHGRIAADAVPAESAGGQTGPV